MTALSQLTREQADAVLSTAALLLRDPEELAVELFPLIHINPHQEAREADVMSRFLPLTQPSLTVEFSVNPPLTPTDLGGPTP